MVIRFGNVEIRVHIAAILLGVAAVIRALH